MFKKYIFVMLVSFLLVSFSFAITDPTEKYPGIDFYYEWDWLVRETPSWFSPQFLWSAPRDIGSWKNVLPYEEDKYADLYMVIPQLWLITPIQQIPRESVDWNHMIDWREIWINKYLQNGIIEYAWSAKPWYLWKRIDFWHSNFFANDSGRYKTVFANLMWLDPGDEVWYFVRNGDNYDLHVYHVTASYPTSPSYTDALEYDGEWADALIFGCYHGLDWRWMVEATYTWDPLWNSTVGNHPDLPVDWKNRIDSALLSFERIPMKRRKQHIAYYFSRLSVYNQNYWLTQMEKAIGAYLLEKLSALYE
jgi:hypothetical protein